MICPDCLSEQPEWADTCCDCGAGLSFLRDHPRRVGAAVWASMLIGLGLLLALFATLFDQLVNGALPVLGRPEAAELAFGVVLSLLGARAWATIRAAVAHRLASHPR